MAEKLYPIIMITGKAHSGKDTLANIIKQKYPNYQIVKFATAVREVVNEIQGIPIELSESDSGKCMPLPKPQMMVEELKLILRRNIDNYHQQIMTLNCPPNQQNRDTYVVSEEKINNMILALGEVHDNVIHFKSQTVGQFLQVLATECFRDNYDQMYWVNILLSKWLRSGRPPIIISDMRFKTDLIFLQYGAITIRIIRSKKNTDYDTKDKRDSQHISECELDDFITAITLHNDFSIEELSKQFDDIFSDYVSN